MKDQDRTWIAVIGGREGRLLRGSLLRTGRSARLRLHQVESVPNPWLELHQSSGAGMGDFVHRRAIDRRSELLARYAVDLLRWLEVNVKKRGIESLEVFAPPRLESLLQSMSNPSFSQRVRTHRCDLDALSLREIERHSQVLELLEDERDHGRDKRAS